MAISETKMQMVIANYFKDECDVNMSIRQAFEKGFRIGVNKGASMNRPQGEWTNADMLTVQCSNCKSQFHELEAMNFCPNCGADMREEVDDE